MHRTIAVVQARMGSARFPGKTLARLCGRPLLEILLERLRRSHEPDRIVVAIPDTAINDAIEDLVRRLGIACVRGSENDVLARFVQALHEFPAHAVVRVCADNPLTDPEQIDALVRFFWQEGCDFALNAGPACGLPDGLGAEILSASALRKLARMAEEPQHREHVTTYIHDHPGLFRMKVLKAPSDLCYRAIRLDVDRPEDLTRLELFCQRLPAVSAPHWNVMEIIAAAKAHVQAS